MAIGTAAKRQAALLDQVTLFPDGTLNVDVDRANMVQQYNAGAAPPPPAPIYALGVRPFLRVAFFNNPGDSFYRYEDCTPYLRDDSGVPISTRRGRQQVTQKFTTGTGNWILDNRSLQFEALNTVGPHAGQLTAMKPVQFGYEAPWLPGLMTDGTLANGITGWVGTNNALTYVAGTYGEISKGRLKMTCNGGGSSTAKGEAVPVSTAMLSRYAAASARVEQLVVVSDTFNRANMNPGLGNADVGGPWGFYNTGNTFRIVSNQAWIASGSGTWYAIQPCAADVDVSVTLAQVAPSHGLVFRWNTGGTGTTIGGGWWKLRTNSGNTGYVLEKSVSNVVTTVGAGGPTPANGDVLRVVALRNSIKVYINGVLVPALSVTDSTHQYNVGCGMTVTFSSGTPIWDNFIATGLTYLYPRGYTFGINYYTDSAGTAANGSISATCAVEQWLYDSFTGTDITHIDGRQSDIGGVWQAVTGNVGISSNQAYVASAGTGIYIIPLQADGDLEVTLPIIQTAKGVCFRYLDDVNYWHVEYNSGLGHYAVFKHSAAGSVFFAATAGETPANGDVLTVKMRGSKFLIYINGVLRLTCNDDWCMNATYGGLWGTGTGTGRWEDFKFSTIARRAAVVGASVIPAGTQSMRVLFTSDDATNGMTDTLQAIVVDTVSAPTVAKMDVQYSGFTDGWDCAGDLDNLCVLTASDAMKTLALAGLNTTLYGTYLATLNGTGPTRWYRLGETALTQVSTLALSFKEQISGAKDASVARTAIGSSTTTPYRNRGPLAGIAGCSPVDPDLGFSFVGPSSQDGGAIDLGKNFLPQAQKWSIGMWLRSTNGIVPQVADGRTGTGDAVCILALNQPTLDAGLGVGFANASLWVNHFGQVSTMVWDNYVTNGARHGAGQASLWSNTPSSTNGGQNIVVDTLWHRVWMTYDGSNNSLGVWIDGLLDHVELQFSGSTGFTGLGPIANGQWYWRRLGTYYTTGSELVNAGYPPFFEVDEVMLFDGVALSSSVISDDYIHGRLTYPVQTSNARVSAVLDNVPWPTAKRNIDTNQGQTITAQQNAIARGNPVQYIQQVEDTEAGMFFIDANLNVVWVNHATLVDATSIYNTAQFIFGSGTGEVPFEKYTISNNDKLLYTIGEATTENGSVQTYSIAAAQQAFLNRSISKTGLQLDTNQKAYEMAEWLATLFSTQGTRVNGIAFDPAANEASLIAAQGVELGMAVEVRLRPPGITAGTYFSVVAQIQGISNDVSRGKPRISMSLDDTYTTRWAQFGDNFGQYVMAL